MATSRGAGRVTRPMFKTDFVIAAVVGFLVLFAGTWARAVDKPLSDADKTCLACHSQERLEKKLANKETLSLHVQGDAFAKSGHSVIGCAGCHTHFPLKNHP